MQEYQAAVAQILGNRCIFCGSTERLERAHVCPTGLSGMARGEKRVLLDVLRNDACYIRLCHACHRLWDEVGAEIETQTETDEFAEALLAWTSGK